MCIPTWELPFSVLSWEVSGYAAIPRRSEAESQDTRVLPRGIGVDSRDIDISPLPPNK